MGKKRRRKTFSIGLDSQGNQFFKQPLENLDEDLYKKTILVNIGLPYDESTVEADLSSFLPTFYPEIAPESCLGTYYQPSSIFCQQCGTRPKCLSIIVNRSKLWNTRHKQIKKRIVFPDRRFLDKWRDYSSVLSAFDASQLFSVKQGLIIKGDGVLEKVSKKIVKNYVFEVKAKDVTKIVDEVLEEDLPFADLVANTMCVIDQLMGQVIEEA